MFCLLLNAGEAADGGLGEAGRPARDHGQLRGTNPTLLHVVRLRRSLIEEQRQFTRIGKTHVETATLTPTLSLTLTQAGLEAADDFIEEQKTYNMTTLDKNIAALNEEMVAMLGNLHTGVFIEETGEPSEVVGELDQVRRARNIHRLFGVYTSNPCLCAAEWG